MGLLIGNPSPDGHPYWRYAVRQDGKGLCGNDTLGLLYKNITRPGMGK